MNVYILFQRSEFVQDDQFSHRQTFDRPSTTSFRRHQRIRRLQPGGILQGSVHANEFAGGMLDLSYCDSKVIMFDNGQEWVVFM